MAMDSHREHHHCLHHQDHSENIMQGKAGDPANGATGEQESVLDELEKRMFERADRH